MLERVGVSAEIVTAEILATEPFTIGRTESRVVLGSMNVMADEAHYDLTDPRRVPDLRATSLRLADSIQGQLGVGRRECGSPIEATFRALGQAPPQRGEIAE